MRRGGSIPAIRDVAKKTDSTRYTLPALRFKTCRPLPGNVRNRELTIIQRRILRKLRNKKRSIKRKISPRKNLYSYIQSQTTRKLGLFHGDLPITEMHRRTERTSYIPFPLNPETRSDVIPVRLHFRETIPQARQPISHRSVCVNNGMVSITHLKVSHGDLISFQENDARARGEEIRRSFYIDISVEKIIGKFLNKKVRMWRRTKTEWFRLLKTKRGCRLLLKSPFLQRLRSSMQEKDLERTKKFGSEKKVCLGSSFAEHNRMKQNLYHLKFFDKKNEKNLNLRLLVQNSVLYIVSTYCSGSPHQFTRKRRIKRITDRIRTFMCRERSQEARDSRQFRHYSIKKQVKRIKRIELPNHYSEVNHRTPKAVVSYGPNIGHIPHDIRLKDPHLHLRSGNGRGQNI